MSTDVCTYVNTFLTVFQNLINSIFSAIPFQIIPVPTLSTYVYPVLKTFNITCGA